MARGVRKSLVGERFGKLVVKEYSGVDKFRNSMWKCECDCGRTIVEKGSLLTNGSITMGKVVSCGVCSEKFSKEDITENENVDYIDTSLIGQRYGRLVVEEVYLKVTDEETGKSQMYAKCKCDCGNETEVLVTTLKSGKTLSCGCLQVEKSRRTKFLLSDDFIGQRFGKLVVDSYDDEKRKWKCICDCGNIKYLTKGNLTNNGYRSCGNCNGKRSRNRRTREELKNDNTL